MKKIKNRILCVLLLFSIVPLGLFGIFSIYESNHKIDQMAASNLEAISENQIINIRNFCQNRKSEMEVIASYTLTQAAVERVHGEVVSEEKEHLSQPQDNPLTVGRPFVKDGENVKPEENDISKADKDISGDDKADNDDLSDTDYINNMLSEHKNYVKYVASISILDGDFHVIASSEDYVIKEISQMKYSNDKFHTGNFIIGDVYERDIDGTSKKLVPAYVGIYDDGSLIGYVSEELDTEYFDGLRLNMDSLAAGTFYLLDGNGAIITAGDTKQTKSLSRFVTSNSERNGFQKAWDEVDHESNPSGKIYYMYQGDDYVTYYSDVDYTDWGIRVTENLSEQRQTGRAYSFMLGLVLLFLVLCLFVAQILVTKNIMTPIENIMSVFDTIKKTQDYSIRIPESNSTEMNRLADEINELLSHIEKENMYEKEKQRHLKELAECDPLTGINNKKAIEQKMLAMVQNAMDNRGIISVGFLDIDDFRDYNTNFGHQEGDNVIKFVADILKNNLKGEVGRNGGDEFVFAYEGAIDRNEIEEIIKKVHIELNKGYQSEGMDKPRQVPCSIGVVTVKGGTMDYASILKEADNAMYEAKDKGKNTYVIKEI